MEILNTYVHYPFDHKKLDKDLLEHYHPLSLLVSQIDVSTFPDLEKGVTYHIVVTKVSPKKD